MDNDWRLDFFGGGVSESHHESEAGDDSGGVLLVGLHLGHDVKVDFAEGTQQVLRPEVQVDFVRTTRLGIKQQKVDKLDWCWNGQFKTRAGN